MRFYVEVFLKCSSTCGVGLVKVECGQVGPCGIRQRQPSQDGVHALLKRVEFVVSYRQVRQDTLNDSLTLKKSEHLLFFPQHTTKFTTVLSLYISNNAP